MRKRTIYEMEKEVKDSIGYQVRPARIDDIHSVVSLSQFWHKEGCTAGNVALTENDASLQTWLDSGFFFVSEFEGVVIAYAAGVVKLGKNAVFKPEGERFLHVHQIFVHVDHREKGVGGQLVNALLSKSELEGVKRSMVGSNNVDWFPTYRFYERLGYKMFSIDMYK